MEIGRPAEAQCALPHNDPAAASSKLSAYRNWVLFVFTMVSTFGFIDRIILQTLLQPIKADLHVDDAQMGILGGLTFAVLYSLLSIPIARIAERRNRVAIITLGTFLWSIATTVSGYTGSFVQLAAARIGVGIGEAAGTPATVSVIADYFPPHRRTTAMAVYTLAIPIGSLLGGALGGYFAAHWGWRVAFICAGSPGLVLALLLWFTVREPVRGRHDEHSETDGEPPALRAVIGRLLDRRSLLHVTIGATLSSIGGFGINFFTAAYFNREFGLSYAQAGLLAGMISGLPAAVSIAVGGILVDRLARRNPGWYALLPAVCAGLAAPLFIASFAARGWTLAAVLLFATAFFNYVYIPAAAAFTQNMMQPRMRATAAAITGTLFALLGQGLGPLILGGLSDAMARHAYHGDFTVLCTGARAIAAPSCGQAEARGLQTAMMIFPLIYLWSAFHLAWAARSVAADLSRP